MHVKTLALALSLGSIAQASNFAFLDPKHHWHLDTTYAKVAPASFSTRSVKNTHLRYSEGAAALYFSHFLNPHNALSWQVGYTLLDLNWKQNPRFRQKEIRVANASLAWISTGMEEWRWVMRVGGSVDAEHFDVGHSGVVYGLLWGRYKASPHFYLHMGAFGFGGMHTSYVLPVAGLDYTWDRWRFNLIFPMDTSLTYSFSPFWSLVLAYMNFGGPYRYPYRAHEGVKPKYHDPIVEIYSTAAALKLRYHYHHYFSATLSGGWNFGGWLLTRNDTGHHGKYYKYDGAPFVEGRITATF